MSTVPLGLVEDLELERFAAVELKRRAAALWAAGGLPARAAALELRRELREARWRVYTLELELAAAIRY